MPADTSWGQPDASLVSQRSHGDHEPTFETGTVVGGKPTRTAGAQGAEERKRRGSTQLVLARLLALTLA